LDPHTDYEPFGAWICYNVYETLFTYEWNSANTQPLAPLLAQSLVVSGDGLNYTFTLRQGITFHDGTPFNASCVKYNFERLMAVFDPAGPAWMFAEPILGGQAVETAVYDYGSGSPQHQAAYVAWIASYPIIVLGTYTVRLRLAHPYSGFLSVITYEVGAMISPTWVEKHGGITVGAHNTYVDTHTCGTGPYIVTSWVSDDHITLDLNTNYWRATSARTTYPHAGDITSITIKTNADVNSRISHVLNGVTDGCYWPISCSDQIWNRVNGTNGDGTLKSKVPNLKLWCQDPTYQIMSFGFNMNSYLNQSGSTVLSPFTIKSLRESFSYAFDYSKFILNALNGFGTQGQGPIPRTMFGHNDSLFMYNYDIAKAVQKWNQAMTEGLPAILANMSYRLEFYYNLGNNQRGNACLLLKDGLNAILNDPASIKPASPLTINVMAITWPNYLYQFSHKQLPLFFLGWVPDYADPDNFVAPFVESTGAWASRIGLGGSTGWYKALVDGWIIGAAQSGNSTQRIILYGEIQQAIVNQTAYIWAYQLQDFHVEAASMNGYQFNPMHDVYFYHYWKESATTTTSTTTTTTTTGTTTTSATTTGNTMITTNLWGLISTVVTIGSIAVIVVLAIMIVCRRR
jgi:peptide/nickel transport system substrate-binding protein